MKSILLVACVCAALLINLEARAAATPGVAELAPDVPSGTYTIEPSHASLLFRVDHMGFSMYTARFTKFDAQLAFDPQQAAAATLTATVDATSLETDFPFPDQVNFDEQLQGKDWLNSAEHPKITFRSKQVTMTGPNTARIDGELTLRGVTQPMSLEASFNGGYPGMSMDPNARIGFSARGTLERSAFGMTYGIPAPGTNMGVGDTVEVIIEVEMSGPAWEGAQSS
jgi:polyisoprenoid-binding protein YceI